MKTFSHLLLLLFLFLTACAPHREQVSEVPPVEETATPKTTPLPQKEVSAFIPPAGSGVIDVTQPPYSAKGDGITDDTAAIRQAIRDHIQSVKRGAKHLYFPEGTYLISDTLDWKDAKEEWAYGLVFQGDGVDKTVFKLKDNTPGFGEATSPKAVIMPASRPFVNKKGQETYGLGNQGFDNHLYDFTIDTGSGNTGAVALDFNASNIGSVVRVRLHDSGGDAYAGLMINRHVGPAYARDLEIDGFEIGILNDVKRYPNGSGVLMTFERTRILGARQVGLDHRDTLVFGDLTIDGPSTAIRNSRGPGVLVVENATLRTQAELPAAIENSGVLFLRDIHTEGFEQALAGQQGTSINELALPEAIAMGDKPPASLRLPVPAAPPEGYPAPEEWTLATDFGAIPDDRKDDSAALQKAIDDGAEYLLLPTGVYHFNQPLIIRNKLRILMGMKSNIFPIPGGGDLRKQAPGGCTIRIEGGAESGVRIERLSVWSDSENVIYGVDHHAKVPLMLESGRMEVRLNADTAPAFVYDVPCGGIEVHPGAALYAAQFNPENRTLPKIMNHGGTVRILGIKTERGSKILHQTGGGQTEILGGIHVGNWAYAEDSTVYYTRDSDFSGSFSTKGYRGGEFKHLVNAGEDRILSHTDPRIIEGHLPPRVPLVSVRESVPNVGTRDIPPFRPSEVPDPLPQPPRADLLAWFKADAGTEVNPDNEVRRWTDLAGNGEDLVMEPNRDYSVEFRPIFTDKGLRFTSDVFLTSGDLIPPSKTDLGVHLSFSPDQDMKERQVLYLQGDAGSGVSLFLEEGSLHAYAWNLTGSEKWGPIQVSLPIPDQDVHRASLELDGTHLRLFLNGTTKQEAAGPLRGPAKHLRESLGAAYSNTTVRFPGWGRPKRVFGGQFFYHGLIHEVLVW